MNVEITYYPNSDPRGKIRTDEGGYGTSWTGPDADDFRGIMSLHGEYIACNRNSIKTYKTLAAAKKFMAAAGRNAYGQLTAA